MTQDSVVQATSFCNDLAAPLLAGRESARAVLCYVTPRAYVANILAGPNSWVDVMSMAPLRIERLQARLGEAPGVVAAMSLACETASLSALLANDARIMQVDFDRFLPDVPTRLAKLARHLLPAVDEATPEAAARSPALTRYSKAPEHPYDPELRRQVLADGEARFGGELRARLDWLDAAAGRFPALAATLGRFGGDRR